MITHTDYLLYFIKTQALRVAVGIKESLSPIVFTYRLEKDRLLVNYDSYCLYMNALTEEDGRELMQYMNERRTQKAHNLILKKLSSADFLGPFGPTELSDVVPDVWFHGCKRIIDLMDQPQIIGLLPVDVEFESFLDDEDEDFEDDEEFDADECLD